MRAHDVDCATALRPVTVPRILFHKILSVFVNAIFNQGEKNKKNADFCQRKSVFSLNPLSEAV
jgi:hypothetical protein